jgi:hypothetical protein
MLRRISHTIIAAGDGLQRWIDGLPAWLRPPVYGALFIVLLMGLRGLLIVLPIVLVVFFLTGTPLTELVRILSLLALAVGGGFLAGLIYSLLGRWLRLIPVVGPYIAGIVTVLPYMAVVLVIIHIGDPRPLQWPPEDVDLFTFALISLLFGPFIGHLMFRPTPESPPSRSQAA